MAKRTLILHRYRFCFFASKWWNEKKGLLNLSISLFLFLFFPSSLSSPLPLHEQPLPPFVYSTVRRFRQDTYGFYSRKFLGRPPNRTCNLAVKSFDLHGSSPPSFSLLDVFEQGERSNNSRIIDALLFSSLFFSCQKIVDNFIIIFPLRRYKANCEKDIYIYRFLWLWKGGGEEYNDIKNDNLLSFFWKYDNYEEDTWN